MSKTDVARRHTFPRLPFSCPVTVTLDKHFRGYFPPSKHEPNVWTSFHVFSDTFQLQQIVSCWFCNCLEHSVTVGLCTMLLYSNFLHPNVHLSIPSVSNLFERTPCEHSLRCTPISFPVTAGDPNDFACCRFNASTIRVRLERMSHKISMKYVCSASDFLKTS